MNQIPAKTARKVGVSRARPPLAPAQIAAIRRIERLEKQFGRRARVMAVREAKAERKQAIDEGNAELNLQLRAELEMLGRRPQRLWEWRRKFANSQRASCVQPIRITAPNSVFAFGAAFSK